MPGSPTTPGRPGARAGAPVRIAFRDLKRVGTRDRTSFAAQWLAYALPYRRFAVTLAGAAARLGAEVARYAFLAVDSHHLLLAGLPAHSEEVKPPLAYNLSDLPFGRTKAYQEIAAGRLRAVKLGTRTLILADELRRYLASLPAATPETMAPSPAPKAA